MHGEMFTGTKAAPFARTAALVLSDRWGKISVYSCAFVVSRNLMNSNAPWNVRFAGMIAALFAAAIVPAATATTPQYEIHDIGVIDAGDDFSQGFGASPGGIAVGRSIRTDGSQAFTWTLKS